MPLIDIVEFHSFVPRQLNHGSCVLDLGANHGRFSKKMKERYGVKCHAVEANPKIFAHLQQARVAESYNIAMHDHVGNIILHLSENNLAATVMSNSAEVNSQEIAVPCMDLESFILESKIEKIDLLKIDIEGAEIAMLAACSDEFLESIPQITVEFHDFCGITSIEDINACILRLKILGFEVIRLSRIGHQDTLLINRTLVKITDLEIFYIKYIYRNFKGALRIARKIILGQKWAEGYS